MARLNRGNWPQWVKPLRLPAESFTTSASFKWCAKSLPDELLQRLAGVSLTRSAYGRRRYGIIVAQMSLGASG
jgi:hypothetical protein